MNTYAAAAARLSKGLAAVVKETIPKNTTIKTVITASLFILLLTKAKIHRGVISITKPMLVIVKDMNWSIR